MSDDAVWEVNVVCTTNELVELKKPVNNAVDSKLPAEATPAYTPGFLQRLYAYMKIKDLLKEVGLWSLIYLLLRRCKEMFK